MTRTPLTETEEFYKEVLGILLKSKIPFMIGGTYAIREYTGIKRETKDLDIFCKAGDYQRILNLFREQGFKTELTDARWVAKILKKKKLVDLIFGAAHGLWVVDDTWFEKAPTITFFQQKVKLIPPEELFWCKALVLDRTKYDGADINHLILKKGKELDWKKILTRMEAYWEILLTHVLNFRFVYPSERELIPKWLIEELINRVEHQLSAPTPKEKVCRGTSISRTQYIIDVEEWGFYDFHNPN